MPRPNVFWLYKSMKIVVSSPINIHKPSGLPPGRGPPYKKMLKPPWKTKMVSHSENDMHGGFSTSTYCKRLQEGN